MLKKVLNLFHNFTLHTNFNLTISATDNKYIIEKGIKNEII